MCLAYDGIAEKEAMKLTRKKQAKTDGVDEEEEDDKDDDPIANKWTHATGGNRRYGGWTTEAIE